MTGHGITSDLRKCEDRKTAARVRKVRRLRNVVRQAVAFPESCFCEKPKYGTCRRCCALAALDKLAAMAMESP